MKYSILYHYVRNSNVGSVFLYSDCLTGQRFISFSSVFTSCVSYGPGYHVIKLLLTDCLAIVEKYSDLTLNVPFDLPIKSSICHTRMPRTKFYGID